MVQVAFACHPHQSMESRIGWRRAIHAARRHDVTVLHGAPENDALLRDEAQRLGVGERLHFLSVDHCRLGRMLSRSATTYYVGYRLWHACAYREAKRLHAEEPFDIAHQTTFCGYREPGYLWRLGVPFVWGPIGGTQSFPVAYLGGLGFREAWIEVCRNLINAWQLRFSRRVRTALGRAAVVVAATRRAADDLERATGRRLPVCLETALDTSIAGPREPRRGGEVLRVLWAGRLRAWKTLPLLFDALRILPPDVPWRLRVLGVGSSERAWRRQAERLGIADRVEWLGWPDYRQTLPHYQWADVFAFTSMRDTSGTGLLEALAAGTPIVGVDHQGAADVMTPSCAIAAPVGDPAETVAALAGGLQRLARDPALWAELSAGARREAASRTWDLQAEALERWYDEAFESASKARAVSPAPGATRRRLTALGA